MAAPTASVTITRRSARDVRQRAIFVSMDGERIAVLEFGDTVTRDVPPGRHVFRAHNTLVWKTVTCDVNPGDHVRFNAVNKPGFGTYAMLGLLGTGPLYLTFEREADQT